MTSLGGQEEYATILLVHPNSTALESDCAVVTGACTFLLLKHH